jgi:tetratricopeptide (TPR) repeat protein
LDHYQAALGLEEPQPRTLVNVAIAYFEVGDLEKAESLAQEALTHGEELAPADALLGAIALERGRPQEALPYLERAVALEGASAEAYFFLGLAYKSVDQVSNAIAAFEQALVSTTDPETRAGVRRHLEELYGMEDQGILP